MEDDSDLSTSLLSILDDISDQSDNSKESAITSVYHRTQYEGNQYKIIDASGSELAESEMIVLQDGVNVDNLFMSEGMVSSKYTFEDDAQSFATANNMAADAPINSLQIFRLN